MAYNLFYSSGLQSRKFGGFPKLKGLSRLLFVFVMAMEKGQQDIPEWGNLSQLVDVECELTPSTFVRSFNI